jgi:excisionase family DNA binding protein
MMGDWRAIIPPELDKRFLDRFADDVADRVARQLDERPLLGVKQAAERLGVSRRTFLDHIAPGLPCVQVGRRRLYEPHVLDQAVRARRTGRAS